VLSMNHAAQRRGGSEVLSSMRVPGTPAEGHPGGQWGLLVDPLLHNDLQVPLSGLSCLNTSLCTIALPGRYGPFSTPALY